jgi:hypothetical protein
VSTRLSGLSLGIFETTTMRMISRAAITATKMSRSRMISSIVESIGRSFARQTCLSAGRAAYTMSPIITSRSASELAANPGKCPGMNIA